jgi:N-acetylglucosamine-6-phosphate deacetylase
MMTIAPEVDGGLEMINRLVDKGVIAAFGHSAAPYEQTLAGFKAGISHVTHLFNAMPSIHHRSPGPLVAIFQNEDVTVELIADGVHIHPSVLRLVVSTLGVERIVTITDGMQAIGLGDGEYEYNGLSYEARDGTARYKDGTLIGTATGLSDMLLRLMKFTGCSMADAVRTVTENPARAMGLWESKGSITEGKDADIVILDEEGTVEMTIVAGRIVYKK